MKRRWKILIAALAMLSTVVLLSPAYSGESPNYRSHPQVLDKGGGNPASTSYEARASVGQEVSGFFQSPNYVIHAGYLYGAYAHVSPRTNKDIVVSRLEAVKSLIPEKEWKKVDKVDEAITKIEESLTSLWWIDAWHLNQDEEGKKDLGGSDSDIAPAAASLLLGNKGGENPLTFGKKKRYGEYVFQSEKGAAKKIKELARKKKYPDEAIEELVAAALGIMDADSTLAEVKIVEAELSGGDRKGLKKARKEMEKAEKEKNKKRPEYDKAVQHYGNAWLYAVNAEEKGGPTAGVQVASIGGRRPVFALGRPYPNPSRLGQTVRYGIAGECRASLKIYDVSGRHVRTLVDEKRSAGYYICKWDGKDEFGLAVANGTYFYRFQAGGFSSTKKAVVLK